MEFVRENVLDCFSLEKAVIGSKGYFCDSLFVLKQLVQEDEREEGQYSTLWKAQKKSRYPFHTELGEFKWEFFYPVEIPEEQKYREIQTIEEAETFFGKTARKKGSTEVFTVNNARFSLLSLDMLYINGYAATYLLDEFTVDGKPFGIAR